MIRQADAELRRISWYDDTQSSEIIQGTYAVNVVLKDVDEFFAVFGNDGANAETHDISSGWTALTDIDADYDIYGGMSWERRRVLVGQSGKVWVKDLDGDAPFYCTATEVGGTGTRTQTSWHEPCVPPAGAPSFAEVARYETSQFIAVGGAAKAWITAPVSGIAQDSHLSDLTMERWVEHSPASSLFNNGTRYAGVSPQLNDIARVGDGVVAVGNEGTVLLLAEGASAWKLLPLGAASGAWEGWDLTGVAVDDVNEFVAWEPGPDEPKFRKLATVVVVGKGGIAARFRFYWDTFTAGPTLEGATELLVSPPWSTVDLNNVTVDERSRIVVGDDETIYALAHEEDWTDASAWVDLAPVPVGAEDYKDVTSDGERYVAVGRRVTGGNTYGVAWTGYQDVQECRLTTSLSYTTDDLLEFSIDLDDMKPTTPCTPSDWGDVTVGTVWPFWGAMDPERRFALEDVSPTLTGSVLEFETARTADPETDIRLDDSAPVAWRVNLVEDLGGGVLKHYRVTIGDEQYFPGSDIRGWRRTGNMPPTVSTSEYDLADLPYPEAATPPFVDVLYGVYVDGDEFAAGGGIIGPGTEDLCGTAVTLGAFDAFTGAIDDCSAPNGADCTEHHPDRDPRPGQPDVVDYFSGMSRFRSSSGHPFTDVYESLDEGMSWRYQSMKHYLFTRCSDVEWDWDCTPPAEPPACDRILVEDWEDLCCQEVDEEDPEDGRLPLITRIPIYSPIDGTAYLFRGGFTEYTRYQGDSEIEDDCAMVRHGEGGAEFRGEEPDFIQSLHIVNDEENLIIRIDHIENCTWAEEDFDDYLDLPGEEEPGVNVGVPVEAGDRIGMAISHQQIDLVVYVRYEGANWRKISYFELLPDGLYNLYRQQFDVEDRLSDPGEDAEGDTDDPIISLEDRDECPLRPGWKTWTPSGVQPSVFGDNLQSVFLDADETLGPSGIGGGVCDDNSNANAKVRAIFIQP